MEDEQEDKNKNKCITPREQARGEKYWKSKLAFIKYHIPVLV